MVDLFIESYREPGDNWIPKITSERLLNNYKSFPKYNLLALDENNKCLGGIFCRKTYSDDGYKIYIDSIQVKPGQRKLGLGKILLKSLVEKAIKNKISAIQMAVNIGTKFPKSWYKKIGFEETNWVYFSASPQKIKFD